ncbi:MAG: ribonuclease P protein component [Calditrichaeota bacterium]|nr:MAG: ribonuclease P protein component [Calditrichota bacterium]
MNLSKKHNLKTINRKDEIKKILESGKRIYTKYGPIFLYSSNEDKIKKTAILIKKSIGSAVKRNYIKRIFRNLIVNFIINSKSYNRVIFIYNHKNKTGFKELYEELKILNNF